MSTILAVANYNMNPPPRYYLLPLCYSLAVAMAINETGARRHEQSPANLTSPLTVSSAAWDLRLQRTLKLYMGGRNSTELPGFFVKQLEEIKEKGHLPRFPASFNASQRQGPRQSNRPPPTHENKVGHQQEGHQPGPGSGSESESGSERSGPQLGSVSEGLQVSESASEPELGSGSESESGSGSEGSRPQLGSVSSESASEAELGSGSGSQVSESASESGLGSGSESGPESGPETGPEPGEASLQQTDTNTAPETKKDE